MASRRIDIILGGKDEISSISARAAQNFRRNMGEMEKAGERVKAAAARRTAAPSPPTVEPYGVAGDPAVRRATEAYGLAPNRVVQRTGAEQADRDYRAGLTRALRMQSDRDIAARARERDLLGPGRHDGGLTGAGFMAASGDASSQVTRTARRVSEGGDGLYKAFKRNTESIENFGKFLKGAGAFAVIREFGLALQRIPEVADQYRQMLKEGYTKGQAMATAFANTVPGLGELAKGIRSFRQFVDDELVTSRGERMRQKDQSQDRARMTADLREQRDARRSSTMDAATEGLRQSAIARGIALGPAGEREGRAEVARFNEERRRLEQELGKAGMFGRTEDQDAYRKKINDQIANLEAAHNRRMKEIREADARDGEAARRESSDRVVAIEREAEQSRLELAGEGIKARLAQIRAEADQEKEEARRRFVDSTTGENAGTTRAYLAQGQLDAETKAADERARQREAELLERDRRQRVDTERATAREVEGVRAKSIADRLRAAGATDDAEKVERAAAFRARMDQIRQDAEREKRERAHQAGVIDARTRERIAAETEAFGASEAASDAERFRALRATGQSGVGEGRLLTGIIGQTAGASFESRQVKAAEETAKLSKEAKTVLDAILAAIQGGGGSLQTLGRV